MLESKVFKYLLSLALTIGNLCCHFYINVVSMLNLHIVTEGRKGISKIVIAHKENPVFLKRPFTTFFTEFIAKSININIEIAFILFNYMLIFINGLLIYKLTYIIFKNHKTAIISIILFHSTFSVLFSFFPPIYTYDEPLQYFLIFLSLIYLTQEKWTLFILSFSLSIICRESSLILIPGIFIIAQLPKQKKILLLSIPVLFYSTFLILYSKTYEINNELKNDFTSRLQYLKHNFQNYKYTLETITSFYLISILPIYCIIISKLKTSINTIKKIKIAFIITLLINSIIVLATTKSREARLFVLPLFFIWPTLSNIIYIEIKHLSNCKINLNTFAIFSILSVLNFYISYYVYETTIGKKNENYFNEYLFCLNTILILHYSFVYSQKIKKIR